MEWNRIRYVLLQEQQLVPAALAVAANAPLKLAQQLQ